MEPRIAFRVTNSQPQLPILSRFNLIHRSSSIDLIYIPIHYFFNRHFNIILAHAPSFSK